MRKLVVLALVVSLFFLSMVAGAEGLKLGRFDGVVLKVCLIGGGAYEKLYEKFFPEFERLTGAKVEIVFKAQHFELDKKLKIDFAAGTADYDLFTNHTSFYTQYLNGTEPLEGYFAEEELSDFIPKILEICRHDEHLWTVPRHADISSIYYRTDIFNNPEVQKRFKEQFGRDLEPPKTWDEFKEIALFLNNPPELYGTQFPGKEEALSGRFMEILVAHGGGILDENFRPAFNGPAGIKAATMLRDLYQAGAVPPGMLNFLWDDVATNFANGLVAMYTEWPGWYTYLQDPSASKVAGKFDLARLPMGDAGIHSGWAGAHTFSVTKFSKNKEAAVALLKLLTSSEAQVFEGREGGFLPTRNSAFEILKKEAEGSPDPLAKKRLELLQLQLNEDFTPPPLIPEWVPISNALYPRLQAIMLGDISVEEGLNEAAREVEEIMKEAGYYK